MRKGKPNGLVEARDLGENFLLVAQKEHGGRLGHLAITALSSGTHEASDVESYISMRFYPRVKSVASKREPEAFSCCVALVGGVRQSHLGTADSCDGDNDVTDGSKAESNYYTPI